MLALRFRAGGMVLFIRWRVPAERRAGLSPTRRRFLFGVVGWWPARKPTTDTEIDTRARPNYTELKRRNRGPVATPAGHFLLPTHREVVAAAFRISALAPPNSRSPRLPCVPCCVSAFHAAAITNQLIAGEELHKAALSIKKHLCTRCRQRL